MNGMIGRLDIRLNQAILHNLHQQVRPKLSLSQKTATPLHPIHFPAFPSLPPKFILFLNPSSPLEMIMPVFVQYQLIEMEGGYEVESILLKRLTPKGKPEYLIKWVGYPVTQSTWEPLKNLENVLDMVQEFQKQDEEEVIRQTRTKTRHIKRQKPKDRRQPLIRGGRRDTRTRRGGRTEPIDLVESEKEQSQEDSEYRQSVDVQQVEEQDDQGSEVASEVKYKNLEMVADDYGEVPEQEDSDSQEEKASKQVQASAARGRKPLKKEVEKEGIEVVEVCEFNNDLYFKVRFGPKTKIVARDLMRKFYPLELIDFYEKNIQF